MPSFAFRQVDVFTSEPLKGNPLAVVLGADGLSDAEMAAFANWTNLSETTFLLRPANPAAHYRLRIFTPWNELPFAGHPTLGTCHVWLDANPGCADKVIVQECGVGLVRIRRGEAGRLAFAAPPLLRDEPAAPELAARIARGFGIGEDTIRACRWIVNGPPWIGVLLRSRAEVLALKPDPVLLAGLHIGAVAPWDAGADGQQAQFEVRAFVPGTAIPEDPVTGSLNAGLAQWLIGAGIAPEAYVAAQGTVLGRAGRIHVEKDGFDVWIGGDVTECIRGELRF